MQPEIRKIVTFREDTLIEGFKEASRPCIMAAAAAGACRRRRRRGELLARRPLAHRRLLPAEASGLRHGHLNAGWKPGHDARLCW